jgi:hypothetical protein
LATAGLELRGEADLHRGYLAQLDTPVTAVAPDADDLHAELVVELDLAGSPAAPPRRAGAR